MIHRNSRIAGTFLAVLLLFGEVSAQIHTPPRPSPQYMNSVGAGVWFLSRPADRNHVRVSVYDGERPGVVIGIALYEAATGRFVREER